MKKSFFTFPIVIITLVLVHFISSYNLLALSKFFRINDELTYLQQSLELFLSLEKNPLNLLSNLFFVNQWDCHPGLFSSIGVLFWKLLQILKLFPSEILMILIPNLFFLIILLCAVYGIIKILYKDKELALLGAFLISLVPIVYSVIRVYMLDFPLMSMVALGIFVLLKTDDFKSRGYSIAAGIIFFLSQITKETSLIFVLPPLVFYLLYSLKENTENRKIILTNFFIFLVIFASLSIAAYYPNFSVCVARYKNNPYSVYGGTSSICYYLFSFIWVYFQPILFLFVLIIFIITLKNIRLMNKGTVLLIWLFFPLVLFSFFPNKDIRFLIPAIPPFLIVSLGALRTKNIFRKFYFFLLGGACILQWVMTTSFFGQVGYSSFLERHRPYYLKKIAHMAIGIPAVLDENQGREGYEKLSRDLVDTIKLNTERKAVLFSIFSSQELSYELWKLMLTEDVFERTPSFLLADPEISARFYKHSIPEAYNWSNYILYRQGDKGYPGKIGEEWLYDKLMDKIKEDFDGGRVRLLKTFFLESKAVYLYEKLNE